MKKTGPLILGIAAGVFAFVEYYIPYWRVGWLRDELFQWCEILSAFAFVLGGVNLFQVNWPKIRRREADWGYKLLMVGAGAVMLVVGLKWHVYSSGPGPDAVKVATTGGPAGKALVEIDAPDDVLVKVGANPQAIARDAAGKPYQIEVDPGQVDVKLARRAAGYRDFTKTITVAAGGVATVTADPMMLWGPKGRAYNWFYDHVFAPCNATMFALLAFFVASAAFRAFRMRNLEATLLLVSAIIVMLACAPMGSAISGDLVDVKDWILAIPNNGGRRAIMMGAAIGAIATSLRIILGLERSHMGAD